MKDDSNLIMKNRMQGGDVHVKEEELSAGCRQMRTPRGRYR
jgi:hypothetical protein